MAVLRWIAIAALLMLFVAFAALMLGAGDYGRRHYEFQHIGGRPW